MAKLLKEDANLFLIKNFESLYFAERHKKIRSDIDFLYIICTYRHCVGIQDVTYVLMLMYFVYLNDWPGGLLYVFLSFTYLSELVVLYLCY